MKSSVQFLPNKHLENITKMFKKLYNDEQLTDVTLCCKDGTIKAHKLILATSSPYFHKIFTEFTQDHPILIMHGVSYQTLHDLIELIYKGNVDVSPESLNPLYELAGEFQLTGISGVLRDENDKSGESSGTSSHGRDTRFKGQKRVAVDYKEPSSRKQSDEVVNNNENNDKSQNGFKSEIVEQPQATSTPSECKSDPAKLSAWARKERTYKCNLCPSSFKRSSHLTRHQLVHTGERPFACELCEKAFSRHDKLKHHIKKAHENDFPDAATTGAEEYAMEVAHSPPPPPTPSPLPFIISHVRSEAMEESGGELSSSSPPKRARGRPRKYPLADKPLVKRGRGRPRLNPVRHECNGDNYDLTNLPYGDLDYLTMPESAMMEPLVEINTMIREDNDIKEESLHKNEQANNTNLKVLENRIAKIGECTISVANH